MNVKYLIKSTARSCDLYLVANNGWHDYSSIIESRTVTFDDPLEAYEFAKKWSKAAIVCSIPEKQYFKELLKNG